MGDLIQSFVDFFSGLGGGGQNTGCVSESHPEAITVHECNDLLYAGSDPISEAHRDQLLAYLPCCNDSRISKLPACCKPNGAGNCPANVYMYHNNVCHKVTNIDVRGASPPEDPPPLTEPTGNNNWKILLIGGAVLFLLIPLIMSGFVSDEDQNKQLIKKIKKMRSNN